MKKSIFRTHLQIIWGKKSGGEHCINEHCTDDFLNFEQMQDSLTVEYKRIADTLKCALSPAGPAWKVSVANGDPIELFSADESHASAAGAYLSACVHYVTLFQKPSYGIEFYGDIDPSIAKHLQEIADEVVLSNPNLWNINGNETDAGFTFNIEELSVQFQDTSYNAEYFHWLFGDGHESFDQHPLHTYNNPGIYEVKLEASNDCYLDVFTDTLQIEISFDSGEKQSDISFQIRKMKDCNCYYITSDQYFITSASVFDLSGRKILEEHPGFVGNFYLYLDDVKKAPYILQLKTSGGGLFKSLIFHQ